MRNSIRNQTPKSKAGTLPTYAYITKTPEESTLNFEDIISSPATSSHIEKVAVKSVNAPERLSDVVLAGFKSNLYEDQTEADVKLFH